MKNKLFLYLMSKEYVSFVMKNPVSQYRVNLFLDLVLEELPMLLVTVSEPLQS